MSSAPQTPAPLVWLNGWSGVGKLSIAQALQTLQGANKFILITHKPPDAANSHPPTPDIERSDPFLFAGPDSTAEKQTRSDTLAAISVAEDLQRTVLITHRVPWDNQDHIDAAREYQEQARKSGRLFLPVIVECRMKENLERLNSYERRARRNSVLSADEARTIREGNKLFVFEDVEGLTLNNTKMPPIEAALKLMDWINRRVDEERRRVVREEKERPAM